MITVLDIDDPAYYGDLSLSTRKKSEILFKSGGSSDGIPVIDAPLPIVGIPPASKTVDSKVRKTFDGIHFNTIQPVMSSGIEINSLKSSSITGAGISVDSQKRIMKDLLNFNTSLPTDKSTITEPNLDITSYYKTSLGFRTENIQANYWDKEIIKSKDGGLIYGSAFYNDKLSITDSNIIISVIPNATNDIIKFLIPNTSCLIFEPRNLPWLDLISIPEENIKNTTIALATLSRNRYFDGSLNFKALPLRSIKSYLAVTDPPSQAVSEIPNITKLRNVPLAGQVISGDYTFIVLNENLDTILHKSDVDTGSFTKTLETLDNFLVVVAVAKDNSKKSYAFKNINVTGVQI